MIHGDITKEIMSDSMKACVESLRAGEENFFVGGSAYFSKRLQDITNDLDFYVKLGPTTDKEMTALGFEECFDDYKNSEDASSPKVRVYKHSCGVDVIATDRLVEMLTVQRVLLSKDLHTSLYSIPDKESRKKASHVVYWLGLYLLSDGVGSQ